MVLLNFPILLSLAAFGLGWGSALRIEIQPPTYTEGSSGPVNVSCQIDRQDSDAVELLVMKITKDCEKPLVVMQPSGIQLGSGVNASKFMTEGLTYRCPPPYYCVYRKDISTSYMKLGILDPTSQDEGKYTCFMFFIDKHHQVSERRASANVVKLPLNDVVMMLRGQVATLEGKLEAQTSKDSDQQGEIDGLRKENQNQREFMMDMAVTVHGLRKENQNQKEMMKDMAATDSDQQRELDDVRKNQTEMMKDMAATVSYSTYFNAGLKTSVTVADGNTIVFDDVMANEGKAYDGSTGLFTAPRDGLYAFHVTLMTTCGACYAAAKVMKDNVKVAELWGRDFYYNDQTSTSFVGHLNKGDTVRVKTWVTNKLAGGGKSSLFSGFLVRAD